MNRLSWIGYINASDDGRKAWLNDFRRFENNTQVELLSTRIKDLGTHVLVRQGQRASAVVTLPPEPANAPLDIYDKWRSLLSISFNTLSDWHIVLGAENLQVFNNRKSADQLHGRDVPHHELPPQALGERLGVVKEYSVVPDYDDVSDRLLNSIELLKRTLIGDPDNPRVEAHETIDDILTAVIFLRFLEDYDSARGSSRIDLRRQMRNGSFDTLAKLIKNVFTELRLPLTTNLFTFRCLEGLPSNINKIVLDWIPTTYRDMKQGRYEYDLNLIAGYSIGQIYEKYISAVSYQKQNGKISLFPEYETVLRWQRGTGALYTPEYLAQFTVEQALKDIDATKWKDIAVGDLACGSGVFLRHFLLNIHAKADVTGGVTNKILRNLYGNDINVSAVAAARLSVAMTTYSCKGQLIEGFVPIVADSLTDNGLRAGRKPQGLILMNPPFKGYDQQSPQEKSLVGDILGEHARGKVDLSMAFLMLAYRNLREDGILAILLPASFLEGDYSARLRQMLVANSEIKFVGKFEEYGIFRHGETQIALLVLQKRTNTHTSYPTRVLYCRRSLDLALRAAQLEDYDSKFDWEFFRADSTAWDSKWRMIPKELDAVIVRLEKIHPAVEQIFRIRQGIRMGRKRAFIIEDVNSIPRNEHSILKPVADDQNLYGWRIHPDSRRLIYAYQSSGEPVKAAIMRNKYPSIMASLKEHGTHLQQRARMGRAHIWELAEPRDLDVMFKRKLVCSHFGLSGHYALDYDGTFAVTNGNLLVPHHPFADDDAWFFYLAILNSRLYMRLVSRKSQKLKGGQYDLDRRFTRAIPIPAYETVDPRDRNKVVAIGRKAHSEGYTPGQQSRFDSLVADMYQVDPRELALI